jgi:acyl CoA:acetate/3-ketoacid CoA transferase alpha subunit
MGTSVVVWDAGLITATSVLSVTYTRLVEGLTATATGEATREIDAQTLLLVVSMTATAAGLAIVA